MRTARLQTMSGITTSGSTGVNTISQITIHSLSDISTGVPGRHLCDGSGRLGHGQRWLERNLHSVSLIFTVATYQIFGIIARTQGAATC